MYCKECGNVCDGDSNFCKHCGLALRPNNTNSNHVTKLSDNGFLLIAFLTFLPASAKAEVADSNVKASIPINTFFIFLYLR